MDDDERQVELRPLRLELNNNKNRIGKCVSRLACVEVWQTSNLRPLRLGEERKKEEERRRRRKIEITGQKYNDLPYYIGRP